MKAKYIALSRGLPKTGQSTAYIAGDDGTFQAGWWIGKTVSNNKERFIAKTIAGDDVVIDRATGLMWAADGNEAGCNNDNIGFGPALITYATGLDFAGFTDWRMPNIFELLSLVNWTLDAPCISQPPFSNTASLYYWSSTGASSIFQHFWCVNFDEGFTFHYHGTDLYRIRCVRQGV